jgi:diguanylate cyclase (GGDEF)-like protein
MKKAYIVYFQISVLFVILICSNIFTPLTSDILVSELNDCSLYNDGWTISTVSDSTKYDTLPSYYKTNGESDVWLSKTISPAKAGQSIGFFSFQQQVSVFIDGVQVYEFVPAEGSKSSTPGNRWNFVMLENYDKSCEITIHIKECYSSSRINIPYIFYGSQIGILLTYIKKESPHMMISAIMVMFGCILSIFCIMYRKKTDFENVLMWLALFSTFRGIWTLIEANAYSFFFTRLLIISQISYMMLKIATVAFLGFVNVAFHNGKSKIIKVLIIIAAFDFWLSIFCQYVLGIDFAQTAYLSHLILLFGGIYACVSSLYVLNNVPTGKVSNKSSKAIVFASIAIVVTSIVDLVRYYYFRSPDIAHFSRLGDFIYVSVISVSIFITFIHLLKKGHNAEQIQLEASTDPLTKVYNRSTFEHDIVAVKPNQLANTGIVMFDLNNLKHFNDVHGHDMGDYYIIISSEIICDSFSKYGSVYRIGGDEFCSIVRNLDLNDFISVRTHIEEYMSTLKMPSSDLHMEVSTGYAKFDPNIDHSLKDTMKRADKLMYQRKMELKNHRDN